MTLKSSSCCFGQRPPAQPRNFSNPTTPRRVRAAPRNAGSWSDRPRTNTEGFLMRPICADGGSPARHRLPADRPAPPKPPRSPSPRLGRRKGHAALARCIRAHKCQSVGWAAPGARWATWRAPRASPGQRGTLVCRALQLAGVSGQEHESRGNSFSDRFLGARSQLVTNFGAALFKRHIRLRFSCVKSEERLGSCSSSPPHHPMQQTDQKRACRRGTRAPAEPYTKPRHERCWCGRFTGTRGWGPPGHRNTHRPQQPAPCPATTPAQWMQAPKVSYAPLRPHHVEISCS